MKKVLCVAAHPDDEILGCGGTLAKHAAAGDVVEVILVAEGLTSRGSKSDSPVSDAQFAELYAAADRANKAVGVQKLHFLGFPDNRMDGCDLLDVVKKIEEIAARLQPEIVYTHFSGDLNVDHQVVNQAVLTACRPLPGSSVREIYAFEVLSATHWNLGTAQANFRSDMYVDIEKFLPSKLKALEAYASEMRSFPHARSMEAVKSLAQLRGSIAGLAAAESFQVLRIIDR